MTGFRFYGLGSRAKVLQHGFGLRARRLSGLPGALRSAATTCSRLL